MFGNVCNYDTMIRSLYEIRQKDSETIEKYMLRIHEAVVVICHTYPEWIPNQGKNLTRDQFYHSLLPSLRDTLSFAMVDLPEHEQANTSFDMLYTLAKKLEVRQPLCSHKGGKGSSEAYRDRFRRYPVPTGRVATLEEEELFPLGPETQDSEPPEFNWIEGLSMRMTQAMNHYQQEEWRCFVCGVTDQFARDCPHCETFCTWHKEHLNSKGAGPENEGTCPKKT